jgi:hypothetical protein
METAPLRVVLRMETSPLSSAIQQFLAGDPRLEVELLPPGETVDTIGAPAFRGPVRTVEVGVLEDPSRIELRADAQDWVLEYRGLEGLAVLLVDCQHVNPPHAVRAHGR